ncbi:MAG: 1-acyl-sn-glycerol-3-phosphate acyltransferase [Clostridia bacterium]|nr:1-acyl-sn-glycerol-3-phosphate acyltransferase [Clostridia bacterium]
MYYRHNLNYEYPAQSDQHMIHVPHLWDVNLDENYPYLQKGPWFALQRGFMWVVLHLLLFPLLRITHGLRIHGKEILKKHKDLLDNGFITVANHVFMWDFLCVMKALRPRLGYFPAWKINLEGPNGPLIRMAGGIPIPTGRIACMKKFKDAMEEVLASDRWMHFYPEGSMWFYYPDIRPLKKAVFQYAVRYDRPLFPLVFTFRPRNKFQRLFGKAPLVDLTVGEPLRHHRDLSRSEAVEELRARTYHIMQGMAGIHPGDPTYNVNQDIAAYQKTM